jgi:4-amino-4-deoxy-L-arabinose transferase-like glycosyltransferase
LVADRLRAVPPWAWLAAIVLVSFAVRAWLARGMVAPFILVDELIYSELAKSLAESGERLARGVPAEGYGVVYPALIAPAYALFNAIPEAYTAVKTINAFVMSLAAIPAYCLGRLVLGRWWALAAAGFAVLLPSMAYTGTVMTENAFYPVFLLAVLALAWTLERPTLVNQLLLLLALALAVLTRLQAVALVPAMLTAPLLVALFERSTARLRRLWPLYAVVVAGGAAILGVQALRGQSPRDLLGAYSVVGEGGYDVGRALQFLLYHWAELDLYVGVLPIAAALLLTMLARTLDGPLQRFLAVTLAVSFWLVLVVAVFASRFADRIQERNAFVVVPLFLILLLAWVQRGAPRPLVQTAAAVVTAVVAVLAIPFDRFVGESARSDTLMLLPWWSIQDTTGLGRLSEIAFAAAVAVGVLFLLVPRRWTLVLVGIVAAYWVVAFRPVWFGSHGFRVASEGALYQGIRTPDRDWIDAAVPDGAEAAMVWSGRPDHFTVHPNEFFNRKLGRIYYLNGPTPGGEAAEEHVRIARNGVLRLDDGKPIDDRYLILDSTIDTDAQPLGRDPGWGLTLYRVRPPVVSLTELDGLYDDTWSGPLVTWTRRRCRGGTLTVAMSGDSMLFDGRKTTVTGRTVGAAPRAVSFPQDQLARLRMPLVPHTGHCVVRFSVSPTAVPAEVEPGSIDTRRLGTHFVTFTYERPQLR